MSLPVETVPLHTPSLETVRDALSAGLARNFAEFSVNVVECPDLSSAPFSLAAPGLGGSTRVADIGGVPNLTPVPKPEKVYSLPEVLRLAGLENGIVIGPGAASSKFIGEKKEKRKKEKTERERKKGRG